MSLAQGSRSKTDSVLCLRAHGRKGRNTDRNQTHFPKGDLSSPVCSAAQGRLLCGCVSGRVEERLTWFGGSDKAQRKSEG